MNLWILHYSFINHHFNHSTITIKEKIIINKFVTELLWGHFLWQNSCSNEKRQIPRNCAVKIRIPRWNPRLKYREKNPNSAYRLEIPRPAENCGPFIIVLIYSFMCMHENGTTNRISAHWSIAYVIYLDGNTQSFTRFHKLRNKRQNSLRKTFLQ